MIMMKHRDIHTSTKKNRRYYSKKIHIPFAIVCIFALSVFVLYENINNILFAESKVDIIGENMHDIALYFQYYDKNVTEFLLTIDNIISKYTQGEKILQSESKAIDDTLHYIKTNDNYLFKIGFDRYKELSNTLIELIDHKEEIYRLLGVNEEKNYLVILQNTAEKRPNGGFFGSFAFVSVHHGHITQLEIIDAYFAKRINNNVRVASPERAKQMPIAQDVGFISSNKFGFTRTDGHTIKTLFEQTFNNPDNYKEKQNLVEPKLFDAIFNKNIQGVIFVRSDFLTLLLPGLEKKLQERQFVNANIDQIRGDNLPDKKALYKADLANYINENKGTLIKNFIKKFDTIIGYNYINIHLEDTTPSLRKFLEQKKLTTHYSSGNIYSRDSNNSFNKIDSLVSKRITITDDARNERINTTKDILSIESLKPNTVYTMTINYHLAVDKEYTQYIQSLEKKYNVVMSSREKGIMGIQPVKNYYTGEPKRWETVAHMHFPKNTKILSIQGDMEIHERFTTPFSQGIHYVSTIREENFKTNTIQIEFILSDI